MKTDDEMYQSVLSRYNDYQQKKKHRIIITRRIVSLAACFVAIFSGYQIWNKISATPPQIPIIEETTETTFNPVTTTKTDTTATTEKTTEITADTTTATITSDNSTANITQTTAVSSAVQSTAVNTDETVTTAVKTSAIIQTVTVDTGETVTTAQIDDEESYITTDNTSQISSFYWHYNYYETEYTYADISDAVKQIGYTNGRPLYSYLDYDTDFKILMLDENDNLVIYINADYMKQEDIPME